MKFRTIRLPEFVEWFEELDIKGKAQVGARILKIETDGYFGDAKDLGNGLAEPGGKAGGESISRGSGTLKVLSYYWY